DLGRVAGVGGAQDGPDDARQAAAAGAAVEGTEQAHGSLRGRRRAGRGPTPTLPQTALVPRGDSPAREGLPGRRVRHGGGGGRGYVSRYRRAEFTSVTP